jgi:hypothetical protein
VGNSTTDKNDSFRNNVSADNPTTNAGENRGINSIHEKLVMQKLDELFHVF